MRNEILLDAGWQFHKGEIEAKAPQFRRPTVRAAKTEQMRWGPAARCFSDGADGYGPDTVFSDILWETVDLPHDYVITGEVSKQKNSSLGFFTYEPAWYRKHIVFGEAEYANRHTLLLFEGAASVTTVYFNGCLMKRNGSGYNSFTVDLTDYIQYGEDNVIAVHTEPHGHEGWWYEGGGIYRHVRLIVTDELHFELWGVYIAPRKAEGGYRLETRSEAVNDGDTARTFRLEHRVLDASGACVLTYGTGELTLSPRSRLDAYAEALLPCPALWDIDDPNLYTLESRILENGDCTDCVSDRFGCRDYVFDPDEGLILNGRHVKIKGVCMHQDFGLTGKAVPDNILRYKVRLVKEMGANGMRMSHYMHPAATMDALDEMGFIVLDETRWFESTPEALEQMASVIRRDRNRPSVFMWSLGNEEPYHKTDNGRRINRTMSAYARKLDLYRPVTSAMNCPPTQSAISADVDIIGINYHPMELDAAHEMYPQTPVFSSECCATGTTRGWYDGDDPARAVRPAYDRDTNASYLSREHMWKIIMARPWLGGGYQWDAFEHRGEAEWPRLCSVSGAIDLYAQKKDAFYQNRSLWVTEPMFHLLPHWNLAGREGEPIRVCGYTNCEEAELFLNGESLGRAPVEKWGHAEWAVPYEPGVIEGVGYIGGKEACRDRRETSGAPYRLVLQEDCPAAADGRSLAVFTCLVLDGQGREVPDAAPFVRFTVSGGARIASTGSANNDPVPVNTPERRMYAGRITVGVRPDAESKGYILRASAEGLLPGKIEIRY